MKNILFIAMLLFHYGSMAQIQKTMETSDSLIISQTLENDYFNGIYTGDVERLRKVYHPGTLLWGDVKGQPYAKTLAEYLDGVANRQSPRDSDKPFKGEVLDVRVTHSIAVAEVRVRMYDFLYHEYLSFHKIGGKWLLVNKMISDVL
ncbi:Putative lumazine-binding [Dyadobacter sp. SG02]|uniref:nuclear transport factor 2 family protein n=1 Tax=Dyadobacter sp. SG02 TaxID=1855291 RepID=UPI0008C99CE7|nr:nuclear transport factor 2 family protein [Dyadobacter sp. SG02]SEI54768.1 Putative lumazine-binding [Dyadobacter sp. SG02]